MTIKGDENNCGKRNMGIIENIFISKDNTIRSIRIRTRKRSNERQTQLLHPMEFHYDSKTATRNIQYDKTLNVNAEEFQPKRLAAAAAEQTIRDVADNENQRKIIDLYHIHFDKLYLGEESNGH